MAAEYLDSQINPNTWYSLSLPTRNVLSSKYYKRMHVSYLADCASKATVSTADMSDELKEHASSDSDNADAGLAFPAAAAGSSWSTSLGIPSSSSFSRSRLVAAGTERRGDDVAAGFVAAASDGSVLGRRTQDRS